MSKEIFNFNYQYWGIYVSIVFLTFIILKRFVGLDMIESFTIALPISVIALFSLELHVEYMKSSLGYRGK